MKLRGTEAGLVGYWQFNEGQGTTAFDSSPIPHNGTLVGATWTTDTAPIATGPRRRLRRGLPGQRSGRCAARRRAELAAGRLCRYARCIPGDRVRRRQCGQSDRSEGRAGQPGPGCQRLRSGRAVDFGKTYYWRVDEVNAPPSTTIIKGSVWSFTVESYSYAISPVKATASSRRPAWPGEDHGRLRHDGGPARYRRATMWLSDGSLPNWIQYQFDKVYKLYDLNVWNSNHRSRRSSVSGPRRSRSSTRPMARRGRRWTTCRNLPGRPVRRVTPTTHDQSGRRHGQVRQADDQEHLGRPAPYRSERSPVLLRPGPGPRARPATGATGRASDVTLGWRGGREAVSHKVLSAPTPAVTNGTLASDRHGHFDPWSLTSARPTTGGSMRSTRSPSPGESGASRRWSPCRG